METSKYGESETPKKMSVWPMRLFIIGSLVSIASGVTTYFLKSLFESVVLTLIAEEIVVLLSVLSQQSSVNRQLSEHEQYLRETVSNRTIEILRTVNSIHDKIAELSDITRIAAKLEQTNDPIIGDLYRRLLSEIKLLDRGTYHLKSLEEVYKDDVQSIMQLDRGEILRSTCPLDQSNPEEQLRHKGFEASIQAHLDAVKHGVVVKRLYLAPERSIVHKDDVRKHLKRLQNGGLDVRVVFKEEKYRIEQMPHHDLLIFGDKKVSIGIPDITGWKIKGATVFMSKESVDLYIGSFDLVFGLAERMDSLF